MDKGKSSVSMWRLLRKDAMQWGLPISSVLVIIGLVSNRPSLETMLTIRFIASLVGLLGLGILASFLMGLLLRWLRIHPDDEANP